MFTSGPGIDLLGIIDVKPPELIDVKLSKNEVEAPGTIEVEVIGGDIAGLEHGWLRFQDKITNKRVSVHVNGEYIWNPETNEYETLPEEKLKGIIGLDQYKLPGDYELVSTDLYDRAGNIQYYYKDPAEWDLENDRK